MKETKTFELTAAETAVIVRAIDLAREVSSVREDEAVKNSLPSTINSYALKGANAETLTRLSWKVYANQVTGATITMVEDSDL